MITPDEFNLLLPLACKWTEEQECLVVQSGLPLTPSQIADARKIGLAQPELVRLMGVPSVPFPDHAALRAAAELTGLLSPRTAGLCLRYGIFVRLDCWGDRRLIVHELVHTLQYERLGGIEPFLHRYLLEVVTVGYLASPMEREAISATARICA